jgi:tetratricopeptide (TPR) repeat protein
MQRCGAFARRSVCRLSLVFLALVGMFGAGSLCAAAQTFGLDDGRAALAARTHAEWVRQARILERRRDWPGLLVWGRDWAAADAGSALARFVQGRALAELGRLPEAIAAYREALKIDPADVWALNNLGNALRDSGHPREAMQAYRAAVEIDSGYIAAWHNLGWMFYLAKGEAGVAQALQRLDTVDPRLSGVWRALALDYALTRDARVAQDAVRVLQGLDATERARLFRILFDEGWKSGGGVLEFRHQLA